MPAPKPARQIAQPTGRIAATPLTATTATAAPIGRSHSGRLLIATMIDATATAVRKKNADSFSADTDQTNSVGTNNNSSSVAKAGSGPYDRRSTLCRISAPPIDRTT